LTALEIRSLDKRFGRRQAVRDLSLTVASGSIYGLVGPNGSGKTTTLACTLGLMRPTSGTARVLGRAPHELHRLGGRLAVVFDSAIAIPHLRVRQNLEWLRRLAARTGGRGIDEALELVGLRDLADARARTLSLGQRKRLAIAGALLGEPELLVLDEPLSGLDALSVRRMLRLFRRLRDAGTTLVLSSHRLPEMQRVVTHVGILLAGRLERSGTLDEVLGRGRGRYRVRLAAPGPVAEALAGLAEVSPEDDRTFVVGVAEDRLPRVHRALVEAGCELRTIEDAGASLQAVFEQLVDARMTPEGTA
jgi:ABC-2 type transport system ATP-binding protein